jgi:beta-galactosidase
MRRLHLFVNGWGAELAGTVPIAVQNGATTADNTTLRWAVRTQGVNGPSFIFVNNYQRLATLAPKPLTRFQLLPATNATEGGEAVHVPSDMSPPLNIPAGVWFVWPVNVQLSRAAAPVSADAVGVGGGASGATVIAWATAQLLTRVAVDEGEVIFFTETAGVDAEVALLLGSGATLEPGSTRANVTVEAGGVTVLRNIPRDTAPFVVVQETASAPRRVLIVMLPADAADRVYTGVVGGRERVILAPDAVTVLPSNTTLDVRSDPASGDGTVAVSLCPPNGVALAVGGAPVPSAPNGAFETFNVPVAKPPVVTTSMTLTRPAGPARDIPLARSGKPREPNATEWGAAAVYTVTLHVSGGGSVPPTSEVRLAIDYDADCARVYFGDRLLTDNWFSGYSASGDGACEVGLTYLAGENPGLLADGANLTVFLLPVQKVPPPPPPHTHTTSSTSSTTVTNHQPPNPT